MSGNSVKKANFNTTVVLVSISIFLMVAPALASSYFGFGVFTVLSQSMKPYMSAGDAIVTGVVLARDVKTGDVVLVRNPKSFEQVSHRVVQVNTTDNTQYTIITKGDANPAVDTPALTFNAEAPLRRVVTVVPKVGYVLNSLSSTAGRVGGVGALIGYVAFLVLKVRRKSKAEQSNQVNFADDSDIATRVELLVNAHLKSLEGVGTTAGSFGSGGPIQTGAAIGERTFL